MNKNHYLLPVIGFDESIMLKAKGSFVFDENEKKYLDLNAGQFCTVLGHCNKEIDDKIVEQINKMVHTATGMLSEPVIKLSKIIYTLSGEMKAHSILLSTGAEAIEFAIRNAKAIKKRQGLICFKNGYHGLSLGAQSITYGGIYSYPQIPSIFSIDSPKVGINNNEEESLKQLEAVLKNNSSEIAAAIFEPIISVGGLIIPSSDYFKKVKELCTKYDVLLILDECQTGFGRTGMWFAYQSLNIIPDIVVLAKGIGLGHPVSMVLINQNIVPDKGLLPVTHYSSHQNDAMPAAIMLAGIKYIEENNVLNRINQVASNLLNFLCEAESSCPYLKNPRGKGFMLGIDLYNESIQDYRKVYKDLHEIMMKKGIITQGTDGGRVLRFLPDYLMEESYFKNAISLISETLNSFEWNTYVQ